MKFQKGKFIGMSPGFSVKVPHTMPRRRAFEWEPSGLYITYDLHTAYIAYAGEKAGESGLELRIPNDPTFLRSLAEKLEELADEREKSA